MFTLFFLGEHAGLIVINIVALKKKFTPVNNANNNHRYILHTHVRPVPKDNFESFLYFRVP